MKEQQARVAEFVSRHRLQADVAHRLLDAMSELGEVAKEVLKGSRYGSTALECTPALRDELGDLLFSLLCVAELTGTDVELALNSALARYEARIAAHGTPGSVG